MCTVSIHCPVMFISAFLIFRCSPGDTMTVQDADAMDLCAAAWAVFSYVIADMDDMLPR